MKVNILYYEFYFWVWFNDFYNLSIVTSCFVLDEIKYIHKALNDRIGASQG